MADITKTLNELFWGEAQLCLDATGTVPTSEVGYKTRDKGIDITVTSSRLEHMVEDLLGTAAEFETGRSIMIVASLDQYEITTVSRVLALNSDYTVGGSHGPLTEYAARVIGHTKSQRPIHVVMDRCVIGGDDKTFHFGQDAVGNYVIPLKGLEHTTTHLAKFYFGNASQAITLATGAALHTKAASAWLMGHLILTSESGTTDDLDDLTGSVAYGAGDDGLIVRIQPASGHAINVNHASGVIELKGAADVLLDDPRDWMDLYRLHSGTSWMEIAHRLH